MATVVEVTISIDGKKLNSFINLRVRQDILAHNTCEVACRIDAFDKFSSTGDTFVLENAKDLIGKKIKIDLNSLGKNNAAGKTCTIFKGIVTEITGSKYQDAFSGSIVFTGSSMDILLDGDHQCRAFISKKLDDVVKEVLHAYSANLFDNSSISSRYPEIIPYVVQYNETDFQFIQRLALTYGEWMMVTGDNRFYFGQSPDPKTRLMHGKDMHEFSFSMKLHPFKFSYTNYDYFKESSIQKNSSLFQPKTDKYLKTSLDASNDIYSVEEQFYFNMPFTKDKSEKELELAVKTDKKRRVSGLNLASGSSENYELTVGSVAKMEGLVDTGKSTKTVDFGEYRIISLFHSLDEAGNYLNHFEALPVSVEVPPHSNPRIFPVCETQSARISDNNDPEGLGRVKVQFYWGKSNNLSPWIRVVTPYAGKNKGIFFIPEVGEEVLVAFENTNAEKPYVLAAHYNGNDKPDDWKNSKNYKKAIRTSSGHTIEFNDEGGKEEIIVYDKDKNNTIILSSHSKELKIISKGNIILQADQNIEIKADKDITFDATNFKIKTSSNLSADITGKIDLSATQDYSLEALNVNQKAKAKLAMEAQVQADLKATIIKIG